MDVYRIFGWLIPGLCMAAVVGVWLRQSNALSEADAERDAAVQAVQQAKVDKEAVLAQGQDQRYAAEESSELEQAQFLSDLRSRVARNGATITNWTTQKTVYGTNPNTSIPEEERKKQETLLKGITRVSSTLTLSGSYGSIQSFLSDLSNSDRLFTLSQATWTRSPQGTNLVVTVSRYLAPEGSDKGAALEARAGSGRADLASAKRMSQAGRTSGI
jgi:Tfp pilus assembly protein PilO